MTRCLRPRRPGRSIFFTLALADWRGRTLVDRIGRLRDATRTWRAKRPFRIDAWVVLPDHFHALWTLPEGDADHSTRWRLIKMRFSGGLPAGPVRPSHLARQERAGWQRRSWEHHIRDEGNFAAHLQWCWFNPVKHGFVERSEDWAYSSVHRDIRGGADMGGRLVISRAARNWRP
jgi:putative transposase